MTIYATKNKFNSTKKVKILFYQCTSPLKDIEGNSLAVNILI